LTPGAGPGDVSSGRFADAMRVASIGDNCIDIYHGTASHERAPGGNAVNVAVSIAHQNVHCAYVGTVGTDEEGEYLLQALASRGVDTSLVTRKVGPTGRTHIEVRNGERHFASEDAAVQSPLVLDEQLLAKLAGFSLVHFSAFSNWQGGPARHQPRLADEIRYLKQRGVEVSLDFGERSDCEDPFTGLCGRLDILFFSRAEMDTKEVVTWARNIYKRHAGIVVVTRAAEGSIVVARQGVIHKICARPIEVTDTCGAGDCYIGTFLAEHVKGRSIPDCAQAASDAAAEVCQTQGAWPVK